MSDSDVVGVIEIPKDCSYKYELEKSTGLLTLDRVLDKHYPANYGFIPDTLSEDGDELDVFVYSEAPIHPLTKVKLEILAVVELEDNGVRDEKLICRIANSKHYYDDSFSQISSFLRQYKPGIVVKFVGDKARALELLEQAKNRTKKPVFGPIVTRHTYG